MKILAVNVHQPDPDAIEQAARVMRRGGMVIYPTDTCYGIGGDATVRDVETRIRAMKGREPHKPFSVIVRNLDMASEYAIMDDQARAALDHYLPGPYTFALLTKNFEKWPYNSIWVRKPKFAFTQALADLLPMPYLSTSANISGQPPAYSIAELEETLLSAEHLTVAPDLILDAGVLPNNPPSTIVDLTDWPPRIIRHGAAPFTWPA